MKKKIFLTLLLVTLIIIMGCAFTVPRQVKKNFTYCFDGEKTGLDTLININGYYAPSSYGIRQWNNKILIKDTLNPNYFLYDNGFVTYNVERRYLLENDKISSIKRNRLFDGDPGGYVICGDTIKLQLIDAPGEMTRNMWEVWFKIIDRNTLQKIATKDRAILSYEEQIFVFRPLERRPNPEDSWIYNKKWFRCR